MVLMPEAKGITVPTKEMIAEALAAVDARNHRCFVDEVNSEPLIPAAPVAGTVVAATENPQFGTIDWTLSNGAKVIDSSRPSSKKTKSSSRPMPKEAIRISPTTTPTRSSSCRQLFRPAALGSYTNTDLSKYTAGKQVALNCGFGNYSRSFSGSTTPRDIETLMELLYMNFKDIEFTADEFAAPADRLQRLPCKSGKEPGIHLPEKHPRHPLRLSRAQMLNSEVINKASREQTIEIAHAMTANAADWTFVFVGNVNPKPSSLSSRNISHLCPAIRRLP